MSQATSQTTTCPAFVAGLADAILVDAKGDHRDHALFELARRLDEALCDEEATHRERARLEEAGKDDTDAEACQCAATDKTDRIVGAFVETAATTIPGLTVKVGVLTHFAAADLRPSRYSAGGNDTRVAFSIARDLRRLLADGRLAITT